MRYQLPDGMESVSVCDREFPADEDGQIDVPDDAGLEVHMTLQSPHHFGLRVIDDIVAAAGALEGIAEHVGGVIVHAVEAPLSRRDEKRKIRELLANKGIREDGRATLEYLQKRLAEVMTAAAAAPPAPQTAAVPAVPEPPASPPVVPAAEAPAVPAAPADPAQASQ